MVNPYIDTPIYIGEGQTTSQPSLIAKMIELLRIRKEDAVLEIGTGCGFQTAVLSELARVVYSIEYNNFLCIEAKERLKGIKNIFVKCGNGYEGLKEHAPFDKIILSCAPKEIPEQLIAQLKSPGILVEQVGERYSQTLKVITKSEKGIKEENLFSVVFVEMVQ